MIDFSKRIKNNNLVKKTDPIEIYNTLDRTSVAGALRPVQSHVLSKWFKEDRNKKDLIVKLHTGAGKTLIGLLMALSYINSDEGPVIYVCPNIYLMQQACIEAQKFGVPFCIINNLNEIPNDFLQGKKILITYVQKVFNGLSIFRIGNRSIQVGCIILDDSHACIDSMLGSCTIQIGDDMPAYSQIFDLVESDLREQGNGTLQDLINKRASAMMPIPYWTWQNKIDEITGIISKCSDDKHVKFAWPIIKDQLKDCRAYISGNKIEISPMCMPIQQYGIFNNATHRILMSATTQEDTFFIKGLGLSIDAVNYPLVEDDYRWSGEKMILIPDAICNNTDSEYWKKSIIQMQRDFGIAVLTPSFEKAEKYKEMGAVLANDPQNKNMYQILRDYIGDHKNKTIVFANRYDGIDLPDDCCRILIIDSVPYYDSLADRYEELCRSDSDIIKIKTVQKIEQGLGRSVRGEKDYSVILITGSDLIKYIRSIDNRRIFSPQTQKQIDIGFDIIEMAKEDVSQQSTQTEIDVLLSTIYQCLNRDSGWKDYYSSTMDSIQDKGFEKTALYAILQKEKEAYEEVTIGNYESASSIVQDIVNLCGDESEKGWYLQEKARLVYHISHSQSNDIQISAFKKNNQLLKPKNGIVYNKVKYPLDLSRNKRIISEMCKFDNYDELKVQLEDILNNLSFGTEAEKAEHAFFRIGQLLGYACQRPDKEIRKGPDVLWCVDENKYMIIECKTEVLHTRKAISKTEAGQMEEHCAWFESEYGQSEFLPVLVIPIDLLSGDAYFSHDINIMTKKGLDKFKKIIRDFFNEFKKLKFSGLDSEFVNQQLIAHGLHDNCFIKEIIAKARKTN